MGGRLTWIRAICVIGATVLAWGTLLVVPAAQAVVPTTLTTTATPSAATTGKPIRDSFNLTGGVNPTGTLTVNLYGPNDATCGNAPVFSTTSAVTGNGSGQSAPFTTTLPGTYRWTAAYSGDTLNSPSSSACNAPNETVTVTTVTLTTTANPGTTTIGNSIRDSFNLSGGLNPTGTLTVKLYGPNDATCATPAVFTTTSTVAGNGTGQSAPFTPTSPGTYRWTASYSGDANNSAASSPCNASGESVAVNKAGPTVTTTATPSAATTGKPIRDSFNLTGGVNPTGTLTVNLYGPNDATCGNAPVFSTASAVTGNGSGQSAPFTTTSPGTYRWTASYSGDANNNAALSPCNAPNETVTVTTVTLTTTANPGTTTIGNSVRDNFNLSGGLSPTGTLTVNLYGPNDATCGAAPAFTTISTVAGNGTGQSAPFTPTSPGTYRWTAAYSGDTANSAASSPCNAPNESVTVNKASPALTTTANPSSATVGTPVRDGFNLSGGYNPGGTLTVNLYGPNDATCANPAVFTTSSAVTGNGTGQSAPFTPTSPGTYRWTAAYSGDANNNAASSPCNAPNETLTVNKASPNLTTTANPPAAVLGDPVRDNFNLTGGYNPLGTLTVNLYGPDDATCANPAGFTASSAVTGNGTGQTPQFTPASLGTYRWTADYSGDANNNAVSSLCNAPNESVIVNGVVNGGFETGNFTSWTTGGNQPPPAIDSAVHHSGAYAALLGTTAGAEPLGDSFITQNVTLPAAGTHTLDFWYFPLTTDTVTFDQQTVEIRNAAGTTVLVTVFNQASNAGVWINQTFDLTPFDGQTIQLRFNVHQDGCGCNDLTSMRVDDVSVT